MGRLDDVDLDKKLGKGKEASKLAKRGKQLQELRLTLGGKLGDGRFGAPVCIVFEGWDASGKGGAIKRLVQPLDLRHIRVAQFSAPTDDEKRHHFLDRFVAKMPGWGGVAVFDRSWYGRVLVERVEGFASEAEWRRGYEEIVGLERSLAAEGTIIVKFWMHVSDDEQLKRFKRRESMPLKRWKLTDEDWRNREKKDAYREAIEDMFEQTSIDVAPWTIVPGNSKNFPRVFVIEQVVDRIEDGMRAHGIEPLTEEELAAA